MMLQGNLHLMRKLLRLLSVTERVVQVTCQLEGKEELLDLVLGKRMRRQVQVEVRFW